MTIKLALGNKLIRLGLNAPQIKLANRQRLMEMKLKKDKEEHAAKIIDSLIAAYLKRDEHDLVKELEVLKQEKYNVQAESAEAFSIKLIVEALTKNL